jgi:DNA-binding NarL/FixJ family response regulator
MESKKVVIIEDNKELREGYMFLLNATSEAYKVIAAYSSAEEAIEALPAMLPNIILMDIDLPGMNGIEATKLIKKQYSNIEVLVITVWENSKNVFDALCAGASGYITKNGGLKEVIIALDELIKGGAPMSANIARLVISSFAKNTNSPLNVIETNALSLLASGKGYKSISKELNVSVDSVKYYIKKIYEKLQVGDKESAIDRARENKWI